MDEQELLDMVLQIETGPPRTKYGRFITLDCTLRGVTSIHAELKHAGGATLLLKVIRDMHEEEWVLTQVRARATLLSNRSRRFLNKYLPWGWRITRKNFIWYLENPEHPNQENTTIFASGVYITRDEAHGGTRFRFVSRARYRELKRGTDSLLAQATEIYDCYADSGQVSTTIPVPAGQCYSCKRSVHKAACDPYDLWTELRNEQFNPGALVYPAIDLLSEADKREMLDTLEAIWFGSDLPMLERERFVELLEKVVPPYIRKTMGYAI